MKKFLTLTLVLFASMFFFTAKSFAAEFELVSYTANARLQWLANIGQPEAEQILKELGKANIYGKRNLLDFDRLEKVNGIYQELSYLATVQFVREYDYKNIFDIGGGYTPRAVVFARDGRKYFGAELMAVAVSADDVMKKILTPEEKKLVSYDEVLVEDTGKFLSSAKKMDGKLCMMEQGLMVFLDQDRLADMYENIRDTLKQNGGCFITSDLATRDLFKELAAALYGEDQAQLIYDETKDMYEELFDGLVNEENFDNQIDAIKYAEEDLGLKIRRAPLILDTSKLNCLKDLTPEQAEKVKKIASKNYLWIVTVD
ncbi:MAG: hypothetical protein IK062_03735 [Selenomonadaceae bacterium]|nr:hypothetical protein [Selenomonadaceae bacterium]